MHADAATLIGSAGVALLLLAFLLQLLRVLRADGAAYAALNLVGAGLACYCSYLIDFTPLVVLEGTWAIVAAVALARALNIGRRRTSDGSPS
jgi:hypothetical protein